MRGLQMINKIDDIKKALENGCFYSSLALALTLPDICAKVEFSNSKNNGSKLYIEWFDKYVYSVYYKYDGEYSEVYEGTEFNGDACYQLRCSFLHSGNLNITNEKKGVKINKFELSIYGAERFGILDNGSNKTYQVRLDVKDLSRNLCDAAQRYYEQHENKELFYDYSISIINIREESIRINSLNNHKI